MGYHGMKGETMKSEKIFKVLRKAWMNWTFITLFFIGIPSFVHADISDMLSNFYPYITAEEEYSTNILLSPHAYKLDDWITRVIPGLKYSTLQAGKYGIDLDVSGGYTYYAKNHDFSYWSPKGNLNAWYAVTPKLTFRVMDYLIRSDAIRESRYDTLYDTEGQYIGDTQPNQYLLSSQRGVHAIYLRNVVEPSVSYRFGRENLISLLYRNNNYNNKRDDLFEDSAEHTINPRLDYWFDVRNGITLEGLLTYGYFDVSEDLVSYEGRGRYTFRFTPKLSLFGEYTYIAMDFNNPGVDYNIHKPGLGIEYKFSPTLTGTVLGGYYWEIPDNEEEGAKAKGPHFTLRLIERGRKTTYTLIGEGGYVQNYFTSENLGFNKYYRAYGTINHMLTERLSVRATGSMDRPKYSDGRKDWIWDGRISASYLLFQWVTVGLEGGHREAHSNVDGVGYSEYSGLFRITLAKPGYQQGIPTRGRSTF
jgi:hypothetical protein